MDLRSKWIVGIFIFLFSFIISPTTKAIEAQQELEVNEDTNFEMDEVHLQEKSSINELPLLEQPAQQQQGEVIPSVVEAEEEEDSEETLNYSPEREQIKGAAKIASKQNETAEKIHTEVANLDKISKENPAQTEGLISKSGHIIWDDEEDKEGFRPDSVEVTLYQNNKKMKKLIVEAGKNNDWTYVFDNLPKADAENNLYDYQVDVVRISNYLVFVDEMLITLALAAGSGINVLPDPPIEKVMRETLIISADEKKEKQATTNKKENSKTIDASATPSINEAATTKMNHSETLPQTGSNSDFLFEFLGALLCCLGVGLCVRTIKIQ